jgi:cytochrome c biogenesis protein CcmG/thiol:disulfide interchange protein DsbE
MLGALKRFFRGKSMTTILAGHVAPAFELKATDGKKASLAESLKKGPAVLAFYKVSCPVCQFTFPFLERIHKAYGTEKVSVLGISQDDARDSRAFMQEYGVSFPSLIDDRGYPVSNAYGLTNVPTVFLVTPDGKAKVSSIGFSKKDLETISSEIAKHTGQPAAPVFRADEVVPDYKPG